MTKRLHYLIIIFFISLQLKAIPPKPPTEKKASTPSAYVPKTSQQQKAIFANALEKTFYFIHSVSEDPRKEVVYNRATAQYAKFYRNLYDALVFLVQCDEVTKELDISISNDELVSYVELFKTSFTTFCQTSQYDPKYKGKPIKTCMRMVFIEAITELIESLKISLLTAALPKLHKIAINTVFLKIKDISDQLGIPFDLPEIQDFYEDKQDIDKELEFFEF